MNPKILCDGCYVMVDSKEGSERPCLSLATYHGDRSLPPGWAIESMFKRSPYSTVFFPSAFFSFPMGLGHDNGTVGRYVDLPKFYT